MSSIREDLYQHKLTRQSKYGYYCDRCRQHNIEPIPYYNFTLEFWDEFKEKYKNIKSTTQ